jgi:hypothetical protein
MATERHSAAQAATNAHPKDWPQMAQIFADEASL